MEILCYILLNKRGFRPKVPYQEIVNAILYKLKTGVQWHLLPVKALFRILYSVGCRFITIIANGAKRMYGNKVGQKYCINTSLYWIYLAVIWTVAIQVRKKEGSRQVIKSVKNVKLPMLCI